MREPAATLSQAPAPALAGKVILITGGNQGIGRAIARACAAAGADVVLAARNPETLHEAAAEIQAAGRRAMPVACDVALDTDVDRLVRQAVEVFGRIDGLVNNAGIAGPTAPLVETTPQQWQEVFGVNLLGPVLTTRAVLPQMMALGHGAIVNIASIYGPKRIYPLRTPYASLKAALVSLTQTLAHEVGQHGIRVNAICPGPIAGERIYTVWRNRAARTGESFEAIKAQMEGQAALRRIATQEEVADACVFLLSEASRGISGQALSVCAGMEWR